MFFLPPVGGVSEREEQDVADYFQNGSGKHYGDFDFCRLIGVWSQRLVCRVCYGFISTGA